MKSSYISTLSWTMSSMGSITKIQNEITKKNTEIATGRYADIGLQLGVTTSLSVNMRREYSQLQGLIDSNSLTQAVMTRTQTGLTNILDTASSYQQTLLSSQASAETVTQMQMEGQAGLSNLVAALGSTDGTRYVFGGINSGEAPMNDYASGPQAAVEAAFVAKFGFASTDAQAANITASDMQDFLNNDFATLFNDTNWKSTWSNASDQALTKQVSQTESVTASVSANDPAIRKLAMAYTMMGYLGTTNLNTATLQVVMDQSRATLSEGMTGVTNAAAAIGVSQNRTTNATTQLQTTMDVVKTRISSLESVDPAEAKTELDTLTNQLSMSYSTTTKLLSLTIMNYV